MGDQVSEQELMQLFSTQPGFVTLKVVRNTKSATAFVEYADLAAAMQVHDSQQVAPSSDHSWPAVGRYQFHLVIIHHDLTCNSLPAGDGFATRSRKILVVECLAGSIQEFSHVRRMS